MENMEIYNRLRNVPKEAKKTILGGRLKGFTDVNPMWRIKALTEAFGPCGVGWRYEITKQWLEHGHNDEIAAFCNINLFYKDKKTGEWSHAIPGTGGSAFIAKETKGPYTSDECFKMALTDALSVACKALGMGADVYWENDRSKYDLQQYNADGRAEKSFVPAKIPVTETEYDGFVQKRDEIITRRGIDKEDYKYAIQSLIDNGTIASVTGKTWTKQEWDAVISCLESLHLLGE